MMAFYSRTIAKTRPTTNPNQNPAGALPRAHEAQTWRPRCKRHRGIGTIYIPTCARYSGESAMSGAGKAGSCGESVTGPKAAVPIGEEHNSHKMRMAVSAVPSKIPQL